jgi:hypothetical protein
MTITKVCDTAMIKQLNPFVKNLNHDFELFIYGDKFVMFFRHYTYNNTLFFTIMNNMKSLCNFNIQKLSDEQLCINNKIVSIQFDQKKYYTNTVFCGSSGEYYIIPYDDDRVWCISKYTSEMILIDLKNTNKMIKKNYGQRIESLEVIYNKYFIISTYNSKDYLHNMNLVNVNLNDYKNNTISNCNKKLYKWEDFDDNFNVNELTHILEDNHDSNYFNIKWNNNYTIAKIYNLNNNKMIAFMNDNLEELKIMNLKDLFNYTKIQTNCCEEHIHNINNDIINKFATINDNCLLYYESCDLFDCKQFIICNGKENIYCFDFTNNKEVHFANKNIDYFCSSGLPFRQNHNVKLLLDEWYPAGNWESIYNNIDDV